MLINARKLLPRRPLSRRARSTRQIGLRARTGGGEANLVLPNLHSVPFFGTDGHNLLLVGLFISLLGMVFGMGMYMNLKNLPVHFDDPAFQPSNSLCGSPTIPGFGCYDNQRSKLAGITETHIFSPNLINEFRFGYQFLYQPRLNEDVVLTSFPRLPGVADPGTTSGNYGSEVGGLAPGNYSVTGHVSEGQKVGQFADCTANFTVKQYDPPTLSCSASPTTVQPGGTATITSQGVSPQNRPLTYSYSASAGQISGSGNTATLSTTGAPAGTITVTCTVQDDKGQTATSTTSVSVEAPPPPPAPKTKTLCSINFDRDKMAQFGVTADAARNALLTVFPTLHARFGRWAKAATLCLIGLVLVEHHLVNFPGGPPTPFRIPAVYRFLATQPPGPVLSLPDYQDTDIWFFEPDYQYFSTIDWFPIANGYSRAAPLGFHPLMNDLKHFPFPEAVAAMRRVGIRYVVLHAQPYGEKALGMVKDAKESGAFTLKTMADGIYLFEIIQ